MCRAHGFWITLFTGSKSVVIAYGVYLGICLGFVVRVCRAGLVLLGAEVCGVSCSV